MKAIADKMFAGVSRCHHCDRMSDDTDDALLETFRPVITVITWKMRVMTANNGGNCRQIKILQRL
jgi:hypothetical protein